MERRKFITPSYNRVQLPPLSQIGEDARSQHPKHMIMVDHRKGEVWAYPHGGNGTGLLVHAVNRLMKK